MGKLNYELFAKNVRNKIWQAFKDNDIPFNGVAAFYDETPQGDALVVVLAMYDDEEPMTLPFLLDSVINRDIDEFVGLFVELFGGDVDEK